MCLRHTYRSAELRVGRHSGVAANAYAEKLIHYLFAPPYCFVANGGPLKLSDHSIGAQKKEKV